MFACQFIALLTCCLIERELRAAMARQQIPELPLYPEDRACTAPTAARVFDHLAPLQRHHLIRDGHAVQTFQPQLTPLQAQLLDLLGVPTSAYTSSPGHALDRTQVGTDKTHEKCGKGASGLA